MSTFDASSLTPTSAFREVVGAEVLVIDKDERVREGMQELLTGARLNVTCLADPADAWELIDKRFFSVVIVDLDTPHPNAGVDTAATVQVASPASVVLALTPRKSFEAAVSAIRAGAADVIFKEPDAVSYLGDRVVAAAARSLREREIASVLHETRTFQDTFLARFMATERRITDLEDEVAGRKQSEVGGDIQVLVVSPEPALAQALVADAPAGFHIESAASGGEALDRVGSARFEMVLVAEVLPDLPPSMLIRTIKDAHAETIAMTFRGPGPGGAVTLADVATPVAVVPDFSDAAKLIARLDDLAEAFRAKERERRYTQAFRERHYDFIRGFVRLKDKLERALGK